MADNKAKQDKTRQKIRENRVKNKTHDKTENKTRQRIFFNSPPESSPLSCQDKTR